MDSEDEPRENRAQSERDARVAARLAAAKPPAKKTAAPKRASKKDTE